MPRRLACFALALLACAGARATTTSSTLTVNATATIGSTGSLALSGTSTLTNGIGSGTFSATLTAGSSGYSGPYTITLTGGGTITGTLTMAAQILGGSGSGTATVTGGTGTYSGATGSFTVTGSSSFGSTGTITITLTGSGSITTGGSGGTTSTAPVISSVLDAGSNTPTVALGGIFIVKGTNLCASGYTPYSVPRPTTGSDGVKITFTPSAGGTGTDAYLVYEYNVSGVVQLAAIVPSSLSAGTYNVTVTNGTASAAVSVPVVAHKFSFFTQDSSGTGLASAQNVISSTRVDLNRLTTGTVSGVTISPAYPGQYIQAYGTGMGALVGGDNSASPVYDFSTNGVTVKAIIGGVTVPVLWAGRAGYAGEDQINFQLPSNVATGCSVSLQLSVNGTLSNLTYIAVAPDATSGACVQPGFTTTQLKNFDQGGTYTVGNFSLMQLQETIATYGTVKMNTAAGGFTKYTGFQLSGAAQSTISTSGACIVTHTQTSGSTSVSGNALGLDAGTVTLNGPSGSNISNLAFKEDSSSYAYSLSMATDGLPIASGTGSIVAGTYTLSGAGGKDVGKFSSTITIGSPLTITGGLPSTVTRSAGLTLNWTGGNSSDVVEIIGSSSTTTGSGTSAVTDAWGFVCTTTAGAKTFTVPASILQQLPAAAVTSSGSGGGVLEVVSSVTPSTFSASLTAGGSIDNGYFSSFLGIGAIVTYQ